MTQVVAKSAGGDQIIGEFESAGLAIGWNRGRLTEKARAALHRILESGGGALDRLFELRHGALVLLRCRLFGPALGEITFDGSQRRRIA